MILMVGLFHDPSSLSGKNDTLIYRKCQILLRSVGHLVLAGLSGAYVLMNSFVMEGFPWKSVTCNKTAKVYASRNPIHRLKWQGKSSVVPG